MLNELRRYLGGCRYQPEIRPIVQACSELSTVQREQSATTDRDSESAANPLDLAEDVRRRHHERMLIDVHQDARPDTLRAFNLREYREHGVDHAHGSRVGLVGEYVTGHRSAARRAS
jgi:hypothetical protein